MFNNHRWKLDNKKQKEEKPLSSSNNGKNNKETDFTTEMLFTAKENTENIGKMLNHPNDFASRLLPLGNTGLQAGIVYIEGLVDKQYITENVFEKLVWGEGRFEKKTPQQLLLQIEQELLSSTEVKWMKTLDEVMVDVLSGSTVLFIDGINEALVIPSQGWVTRGIEEPQSEALVRGPREGFVENLGTNIMMIRRQIRDPNLRFDTYKIGRRSKKSLILSYIDGIVHPKLVAEVKRRLECIDIDDALDTGIIEQLIEDSVLSPFPQMQNTERPDRTAGALLEGRLAIFLDGTPFVLLLPTTLSQMFQSTEDYYERWMASSLIRTLRYFAAFIAMFLPALYIALVSYHPGMLPTNLAFSITATREGVPVPAVMEAIMMEATMELLREAGIRLPKAIGQTIGIVGGLVIGEAAVSAGIVSPVMVIVVALTAISSFAIPSYSTSLALRFLRFHFMIAAAILGLYGIIVGYIMINIHIANLKSFGIPYSSPFAPMFFQDWKDLVFRMPYGMKSERPVTNQPKDKVRQKKRR